MYFYLTVGGMQMSVQMCALHVHRQRSKDLMLPSLLLSDLCLETGSLTELEGHHLS